MDQTLDFCLKFPVSTCNGLICWSKQRCKSCKINTVVKKLNLCKFIHKQNIPKFLNQLRSFIFLKQLLTLRLYIILLYCFSISYPFLFRYFWPLIPILFHTLFWHTFKQVMRHTGSRWCPALNMLWTRWYQSHKSNWPSSTVTSSIQHVAKVDNEEHETNEGQYMQFKNKQMDKDANAILKATQKMKEMKNNPDHIEKLTCHQKYLDLQKHWIRRNWMMRKKSPLK